MVREVPFQVLSRESGEQNYNVGVIVNELAVEVCEAKERLNVLHLAGFWPILNGADFDGVHRKTCWRQNVSEVFDSRNIEDAFRCTSKKPIFAEASEHLAHLRAVKLGGVGENKNVVKIDDNTYINHVGENVVH